jgi:hypothetical protein
LAVYQKRVIGKELSELVLIKKKELKILVVIIAVITFFLLGWLFKGYIWGHDINLWFKDNVTKKQAEKEISKLNSSNSSCNKGIAFHTENYMCTAIIKTNAIQIRRLLIQLRKEPTILRADFLKDLIKEYND